MQTQPATTTLARALAFALLATATGAVSAQTTPPAQPEAPVAAQDDAPAGGPSQRTATDLDARATFPHLCRHRPP